MLIGEEIIRVWIDHQRKIVSFHEEPGFQRMEFHQREHLQVMLMEWQEKRYRFQ